MKAQTSLQKYFFGALAWNGGSYILYKTSQTLLTLSLYRKLPLVDFMTWSITYSWVFLIVLMLSAAIKKSIPRYMPFFITTKKTRSILLYSCSIYMVILTLICTLLAWQAKTLASTFLIAHIPQLNFFLALLLFVEGVLALLETFYYAQFKNKFFNTTKTICLLGEVLSMAYIGNYHTQGNTLILYLFGIKIIWRLLFLCSTLPRISYTLPFSEHKTLQATQATPQKFIRYSAITWLTTVLKSATERNALIPFVSLAFGHQVAATCKMAQDCALLVYRITVKTVSSNDTAFLAYSTTDRERLQNFAKLSRALFYVTTYALLLSFLFLGICSYTTTIRSLHNANNSVFILFGIITIGYVFELLLSPFERILEVTYRYTSILYAYIPYSVITGLLGYYCLAYKHPQTITTVIVLFALIHIARIFTLIIMSLFLKKYRKIYPWHLVLALCIALFMYMALIITPL